MLASYVGEDRFLKGVSLYLKKHMYKNSVTKDLWEGIQAATGTSFNPIFIDCRNVLASDLDIPKMMDNWVKKVRSMRLGLIYDI